MSDISRSKLFSKLGATAYKALESATVFCKLRGNPHVELVHWLFQLKQLDNGDFAKLSETFSIDAGKLNAVSGISNRVGGDAGASWFRRLSCFSASTDNAAQQQHEGQFGKSFHS